MAEEKLAESRCPENGGRGGGEEGRNCVGDCIENDIEIVGEECKK